MATELLGVFEESFRGRKATARLKVEDVQVRIVDDLVSVAAGPRLD